MARRHVAASIVTPVEQQKSVAVTGVTARAEKGSRLVRVAPHLAALALYSVVTVIVTWPMLPKLGGFVVSKLDPLNSLWLMAWQAHALVTNPMGMFDTNIMYPFKGTLAFDELNFAEAAMSAPIYWLTGNPVLSHNALLLLTFILSGYGMWLLVRELTGNSGAGFVAGTAFAFSFYRMDHLPHITLLSAEWMPFILLVAYKLYWTGNWHWAVALGALFTVQGLSSHYLAFYTVIMLGLFVVYYSIAERRFSLAFVGKLAAVMGAALLLMLPIIVPYLQVQSGQQFGRDLFEVERYSNTLASFLAVYEGNQIYRQLLAPFADPGPWPWERSSFPGLVVPLLALLGIVGTWRASHATPPTQASTFNLQPSTFNLRKHVGFFLIIIAVTVVLSLGPTLQITYSSSSYDPSTVNGVLPLPYQLLYDWVPGFHSMRVAARIMILTSLALSTLAGIGAVFLLGWLRAAPRLRALPRAALPVVTALVALLSVAESWSAPVYLEPVGTRQAVPQVYRWLAAQPRTVVAEYPMVYYKPGLERVEVANLYQYYSLYHLQNLVNGVASIRPPAYTALAHETEDCFPCPRSLDALWALGVEYVVVHLDDLSGPQRTDFTWRTTHPEGKVLGDFMLVQQFGADQVYRVKSPRLVGQLSSLIPEGASLLLADPVDDPRRVGDESAFVGGGYIAALGYYLRDHPEFGDNRLLSFGQRIREPDPNDLPDYALLWTRQDPATAGYLVENRVWANDVVSLYKRGPTRAAMAARIAIGPGR